MAAYESEKSWRRGVEVLFRGRGLNGGVMADRGKFTRTSMVE